MNEYLKNDPTWLAEDAAYAKKLEAERQAERRRKQRIQYYVILAVTVAIGVGLSALSCVEELTTAKSRLDLPCPDHVLLYDPNCPPPPIKVGGG